MVDPAITIDLIALLALSIAQHFPASDCPGLLWVKVRLRVMEVVTSGHWVNSTILGGYP